MLYHGTTHKFRTPEIIKSIGEKDFGPGFYSTTDRKQAEQFARLQMRRSSTREAYINQYYVDTFDGISVKEFEAKL